MGIVHWVLIGLAIALLVSFFIGAGAVWEAGGESLWRQLGYLTLWCLGAAAVAFVVGMKSDAVWVGVSLWAGLLAALLPAFGWRARRNHRERRELRQFTGL